MNGYARFGQFSFIWFTVKAGFLNRWATEEFLNGHDLVLLKFCTFCKLYLLIENAGSSWAADVIICSRHYLLEIIAKWKFPHILPRCALADGILRQIGGSCCHENEIQKNNVEDNLICALSCIEPWISLLSNNEQAQPSHWLQRSVCYFKLFLFLLCACATIVALEKMYSRWATDPLFINWGTCFKRLRTPDKAHGGNGYGANWCGRSSSLLLAPELQAVWNDAKIF